MAVVGAGAVCVAGADTVSVVVVFGEDDIVTVDDDDELDIFDDDVSFELDIVAVCVIIDANGSTLRCVRAHMSAIINIAISMHRNTCCMAIYAAYVLL